VSAAKHRLVDVGRDGAIGRNMPERACGGAGGDPAPNLPSHKQNQTDTSLLGNRERFGSDRHGAARASPRPLPPIGGSRPMLQHTTREGAAPAGRWRWRRFTPIRTAACFESI